MYDYLFRRYDPVAGRWLSPDPLGWGAVSQAHPQSLNRYAYVQNNPMSLSDPTGLDACAYYNTDGLASIYNGANGGAVDCPGDGIYITTASYVSAIGLDNNGDLSVYAANNTLYNPDGTPFSVGQVVDVNADGATSYYIQTIDSPGTQYAYTAQINLEQNATSTWSRINKVLQCGSKTANQFSIAGVIGINEEAHPVGAALSNAFLGNTFSGISDAITHVATGHFGAAYADFALGGTAQGLPIGTVPAAKGIVGVMTEGALSVAVGEEMVTPVGWAKLAIDGAAYLGSLAYCSAHP